MMIFKKLFSFKGRICRVTFSNYQFIIYTPIFILKRLYFLRYHPMLSPFPTFFTVIKILAIPFYISLICKSIERLHDLNLSGKIVLLPLTFFLISKIQPYGSQFTFISYTIVFAFYLFLLFKPGQSEPQPKSVSASTIFIVFFMINRAIFFFFMYLR